MSKMYVEANTEHTESHSEIVQSKYKFNTSYIITVKWQHLNLNK